MENIEAMLCAFIEGDLDEAGRAQIEKHLESNPQHRKLLNELVEMRDMVRALPRVKAPMDVGDSLRQKVERSMLLEDADSGVPEGRSGDRWPQFFAIAAILLLVSSLCFIVVRALAPTLKPAVFTQATDKFTSAVPANDGVKLDDLSGAKVMAEVPEAAAPTPGTRSEVSDLATDQLASSPTTRAAAAPQAASHQLALEETARQSLAQNGIHTQESYGQLQKVLSQAEQPTPAIAQVDLPAIRRRLQSSGFGIASASKDGGATLVLVNTSDASSTQQQITQFLNSSGGISWNAVPEGMEFQSKTPGAANAGGLGGGGMPAANNGTRINGAAMQPMTMNEVAGSTFANSKIATSQPASDVYVVHGLTSQQVDALRQTLTVPQKGSAVEVTVQSVPGLATTEPSDEILKDVNASKLAANLAFPMPTTRDSEASSVASDRNAPPATMPSDVSGSAVALQNSSQTLEPVDAVIVLQGAVVPSVGTVTTGAATQPDVMAPPMTIPAPALAVPATQPADAATQP